MTHEKNAFPNSSGPDKLAGHRLHGTDATPDQAARPIAERFIYDAYGQHPWTGNKPPTDDSGDASPRQLFQGMKFDPSTPPIDCRIHAPSLILARRTQQERCGYAVGLNAYAACADNPIHPVSPLPPEGGAS